MKTIYRTTNDCYFITKVSIKEIFENDGVKCVKLKSGKIVIKVGDDIQYHESFSIAKQYLLKRITDEIKKKEEEIEALMKDFSLVENMIE